MLAVLAHLLLAPATLALTAAALITSRVSRWRPHWLAVPAGAGAIWTAAIGVRRAAAGYAALPRHVAAYAGGAAGHPARLLHLPAAFSAPGHWLPRQLPLALMAAAVEAVAVGWLGEHWSAGGRRDRAPARPGLVVAVRRRQSLAALAAGDVVTRDGCGLGLDPASGRPAEVIWAQAGGGVLAVWPDPHAAAQASFPLAAAALRRRKALVVIDLTGSPWLGRALATASAAAGVPLGMLSAAGPGCYEPFHASQDPAALAAQLIDWTGLSDQHRQACERRLADAVAAVAASPAASIGLAALSRSRRAGAGPGPAEPAATILDALIAALGQMPPDPAIEAVRGQLVRLRSSPPGRWLRLPAPAAPRVADPAAGHAAAVGGAGSGPVVSVGRAMRERGAAAFSLDLRAHGEAAAMVARLALADLMAALHELREWRLRGDCLVWVHGCAAADGRRLAELTELGRAAGAAVLLSTASAAAAARLAPSADVVVAGGPVHQDLATGLAGAAPFLRQDDREVTAEGLLRQGADEFTIIVRGAGQRFLPGCRTVPDPWAGPA